MYVLHSALIQGQQKTGLQLDACYMQYTRRKVYDGANIKNIQVLYCAVLVSTFHVDPSQKSKLLSPGHCTRYTQHM